MPSQQESLPYVDASSMDDVASFVSTTRPESLRDIDADSIAPLIQTSSFSTPFSPRSNSTSQIGSRPVAAPNQSSNDPSDKIIMTSVPVLAQPASSTSSNTSASTPSKSIFSLSRSRGPKTKLKIVLLPQSEYDKYFARDKRTGAYQGTEPERTWTEQELDERYARYKSALPPAPMKVGSALKDGGGWGAVYASGSSM